MRTPSPMKIPPCLCLLVMLTTRCYTVSNIFYWMPGEYGVHASTIGDQAAEHGQISQGWHTAYQDEFALGTRQCYVQAIGIGQEVAAWAADNWLYACGK